MPFDSIASFRVLVMVMLLARGQSALRRAGALLVLGLAPTPLLACIYNPLDSFSPLPACLANDKGAARGFIAGTASTGAKAVGFMQRVVEVNREVAAWTTLAAQATAFRTQLETFLGDGSSAVDPLPSFAASYNRQSAQQALRFWVVDGALTQDSVEGMVARARASLQDPATFARTFGARGARDSTASQYLVDEQQLTSMLAEEQFARQSAVESAADSVAADGRALIEAVADQETNAGQAYAELTATGGRINRVRATRLDTETRSQRQRIAAARTLQRVRTDVVVARRPGRQWNVVP